MKTTSAGWVPFQSGSSLGKTGSEGGVILRDDEHPEGARITLEQGGYHPFSVTCGVYGWMVHTRFFDTHEEAEKEYELMKPALYQIAVLVPYEDDSHFENKAKAVAEACGNFVARFP